MRSILSKKTLLSWRSSKPCGAFLPLLFTWAIIHSTEADCRQCRTIHGDINGCWNESVTYFTEIVTESLHNFTANLLHLGRLRANQPSLSDALTQFEERIVMEVIGRRNHSESSAHDLLSQKDLLDIFQFILNKTKPLQDQYSTDSAELPSLSCPTPCDYNNKMYRILFFTMLAGFILCVVSSVTFMCCVHRQTDFAYVNTFDGKKRNRFV